MAYTQATFCVDGKLWPTAHEPQIAFISNCGIQVNAMIRDNSNYDIQSKAPMPDMPHFALTQTVTIEVIHDANCDHRGNPWFAIT